MARAADAIRSISLATGYPHLAVYTVARALRDDPRELWPRGQSGARNSGERVEPCHLTNLLIALLANVTFSAAKVALEVRSYVLADVIAADPAEDWDALPLERTFGESLDSIIAAIAVAPDRERALARIDRVGLARRPEAASITTLTSTGRPCTAIFRAPEAAQGNHQGLPMAPIFAHVGAEIFRVLADLAWTGSDPDKKFAPAEVGTQPARYLDDETQSVNSAENQRLHKREDTAWRADAQGFSEGFSGSSSSIGPPDQPMDEKPCSSGKTRKQAIA